MARSLEFPRPAVEVLVLHMESLSDEFWTVPDLLCSRYQYCKPISKPPLKNYNANRGKTTWNRAWPARVHEKVAKMLKQDFDAFGYDSTDPFSPFATYSLSKSSKSLKAEPLVAIFEYDTPVRIQKFAEHKFSEEPLEPYVPTQHDMLNYYQDWSELEGVEL